MMLNNLTQPIVGDYCILCGNAPAVIGLFKPDHPVAWGAAEGKTRFIRYCLCEKCRNKKDTPENVEKIIKADLLMVVGGTNAKQ